MTIPYAKKFDATRKITLACAAALVGTAGIAWAATSDKYPITGSTKLTDGATMKFRLFIPAGYTPSKKYPLVLLLHGGGEIGNDNAKQLNNGPMGEPWIADSVQQKWAPFALAPQCPADHSFANNAKADLAGHGAVKIIDSLAKVYSLDTTRFYVAGHSFGGVGTLGIISSYPRKFAAAVPHASNAGGPNNPTGPADASLIAQTALWAFHGDKDEVVDIGPIRTLVSDVEKKGHKVVRFYSSARMQSPTGISVDSLKKTITGGAPYLFSEIKNGDHGIGCEEGYRCPLLPAWIFSKAKVDGQIVSWPPATPTALWVNKKGRVRESGFKTIPTARGLPTTLINGVRPRRGEMARDF